MPEREAAQDPNSDGAARNERLHTFSHDLKNRLGGLWEALRLTRELPEGPERDELAAFAERHFFGGLREVERLMDDFNVPRDPLNIKADPIDLVALVQKTITTLAFRTSKKQQPVELNAPDRLMVIGDPHLLEQTVDAVLSNASKFSPNGSRIQVTCFEDGGRGILQIADPGVGLSATDLGQIFVRYALLSSRSTNGESQTRGTLARAARWMKAQNGQLEATSEGAMKGARFTVSLPKVL